MSDFPFPPPEETKVALRLLLGQAGYDRWFSAEVRALVALGHGRVVAEDIGDALPVGMPSPYEADEPVTPAPQPALPPAPTRRVDSVPERTAHELAEDRRRRFPDHFEDAPHDSFLRRRF